MGKVVNIRYFTKEKNARVLTVDSQLIIKAGGAVFSLENAQ